MKFFKVEILLGSNVKVIDGVFAPHASRDLCFGKIIVLTFRNN